MSTEHPYNANSRQEGGSHYKVTIEPWDYIIANGLGFLEGNIIKYISRWQVKGGVEDLKKAQHYLEKLIESKTPVETRSTYYYDTDRNK